MKILITGSTGFVGRNVKEYFLKYTDYEIVAPNSKELDCLDEKRASCIIKRVDVEN